MLKATIKEVLPADPCKYLRKKFPEPKEIMIIQIPPLRIETEKIKKYQNPKLVSRSFR